MVITQGAASKRGRLAGSRDVWGAILLIVGVVQAAVLRVLTANAWQSPPYDWKLNYISDLGNTACGPFVDPGGATTYVCSPAYPLQNTGFVLSGVLLVLGIALLWKGTSEGRFFRAANILWIVVGSTRILVGLAPENVNITAHLAGALFQPLGNIAIILTVIGLLRRPMRSTPQVVLAIFGIVVSAAGLVGLGLSLIGQTGAAWAYLGLGPGAIERLSSYPATIGWIALIGLVALLDASRGTTTLLKERSLA